LGNNPNVTSKLHFHSTVSISQANEIEFFQKRFDSTWTFAFFFDYLLDYFILELNSSWPVGRRWITVVVVVSRVGKSRLRVAPLLMHSLLLHARATLIIYTVAVRSPTHFVRFHSPDGLAPVLSFPIDVIWIYICIFYASPCVLECATIIASRRPLYLCVSCVSRPPPPKKNILFPFFIICSRAGSVCSSGCPQLLARIIRSPPPCISLVETFFIYFLARPFILYAIDTTVVSGL
jgi:hypothetical protein